MKRVFLVSFLFAVCPGLDLSGQENAGKKSATPSVVNNSHFNALKQNSPFTRSLNLSDSLALTGVAVLFGEPFATLIDKNTKQTYVVCRTPNAQGWRMVDLKESDELETVTATISVGAEATVRVRYSDMQLKVGEARPAAGDGTKVEPGKGGRKPEGKKPGGKGPSPELRAKFEQLTPENQSLMREKIREKFSQNPDMSGEERMEYIRKALDKISQRK